MRKSPPPQVIDSLIEVGAKGSIDEEHERYLQPFGWVNKLHWSEWDKVVEALIPSELEDLIRGLTLTEKAFQRRGWGAGSVSSVIWTFYAYKVIEPERAKRLASWIHQNYGINTYLLKL